jgi:hypothetical protein
VVCLSPIIILVIAIAVTGTSDTAVESAPKICATYFNFTDREKSNTYLGAVNDDGTIAQRGNLGYRFDPQGRVTIGKEYLTFTVISNQTAGKGFGCCDKLSLLTVHKATGSFQVASVHADSSFGPGSKQCGKYGCGILEFAGLNDETMTTVAWMDPLFPPPPPVSTSITDEEGAVATLKTGEPNPGVEGLMLGEFDLKTGEVTPIRPFAIDIDNPSATTPMDSGMVSYDPTNKNFWFSCNPGGNISVEGVCSYPATVGATHADISVLSWGEQNYTITSMGFSDALKGAVILGQTFLNVESKHQSTKLFFADPLHPDDKNWKTLVDLGPAWANLHQGTISPCGRYYLIALAVGEQQKYHEQDLIMVDLVKKKVLKRVHVQHSSLQISVLNAFTC